MKAIVYKKYGSPNRLHLENVKIPKPQDNEVLVKIEAAALNALDWHFLRGKPFFMRLMGSGLFNPKFNILGADLAGVVESVGNQVTEFNTGDRVVGYKGMKLGYGAYAEYTTVPESALLSIPNNISMEEAASLPMAATTALQGLRDVGKLKAGQKVLIHGASGGVGTFAVQIAKSLGAEVTAVCSTGNVGICIAIGADQVIDYKFKDFTKGNTKYDLIFSANGDRKIREYINSLKSNGIFVNGGGSMKQLFQVMVFGPFLSKKENKTIAIVDTKMNKADLSFLSDLLKSGKISPVIDRRYSLEELPKALKYLEEGHAKGKIIINI